MKSKPLREKKPVAIGPNRSPPTLHVVLPLYSEAALAGGRSASTVKMVMSDVGKLARFMADKKLHTLADLTPKAIHQFQLWLVEYRPDAKGKRALPLSMPTRARVLANLRSFLKWCSRAGHTVSNLARHLILPRLPKPLPRDIPTLKEIADLIRTQRQCGQAAGLRNAAIVAVLFASGLRRKEAADLDVEDVDLNEREVRVVRGKGGRGRTVPIAAWARDVVADYLRDGRAKLAAAGVRRLFVRNDGHAYSADSMGLVMKDACLAAKMTRRITPHALRHAFCLYLMKGGASIRVVNELAGHVYLRHTARYTRLTVRDLQAVVQQTHPRGGH